MHRQTNSLEEAYIDNEYTKEPMHTWEFVYKMHGILNKQNS